jgi:hypothetical protein
MLSGTDYSIVEELVKGASQEHANERERSGSRGCWTEWEDVRRVGVEFQLPIELLSAEKVVGILKQRKMEHEATMQNRGVGRRNSEALLSTP